MFIFYEMKFERERNSDISQIDRVKPYNATLCNIFDIFEIVPINSHKNNANFF